MELRQPGGLRAGAAVHRSHPPQSGINVAFFREWAAALQWPDEDMVEQVASGVDSRARCDLTTVLRFHHKGLQHNFAPARASVEADTAPERGWISTGTAHLRYVPARLVARNCVSQHKRGGESKVTAASAAVASQPESRASFARQVEGARRRHL